MDTIRIIESTVSRGYQELQFDTMIPMEHVPSSTSKHTTHTINSSDAEQRAREVHELPSQQRDQEVPSTTTTTTPKTLFYLQQPGLESGPWTPLVLNRDNEGDQEGAKRAQVSTGTQRNFAFCPVNVILDALGRVFSLGPKTFTTPKSGEACPKAFKNWSWGGWGSANGRASSERGWGDAEGGIELEKCSTGSKARRLS